MSNPFQLGDPVFVTSEGSDTGDALANEPVLFVVRPVSPSDTHVAVGKRLDGDGRTLRNDVNGYWNFRLSNVKSAKVLSPVELASQIEAAAQELRDRNVRAAMAVEASRKALAERAEKERKEKEAKELLLKNVSPEGRRLLALFEKEKERFGCQSHGAIEFIGALTGDNLSAILGTKIADVPGAAK